MKKRMLAGLIGILIFSQVEAQQKASPNGKSFELKGNIAGLKSPKIMLRYVAGGKTIIDTADVENGAFVFRGKLDGPTFSEMLSTDFSFMHSQYLENSKMTMVNDSGSDVVFSGSATEDENKDFNEYRSALGNKIYLLQKELNTLSKTDSVGAGKRAISELNPLYDSINHRMESYFTLHPKSLVSLYELNGMASNIDAKELSTSFAGLDKSLRESVMGKQIAAYIETQNKTAIGVTAFDFTQKNVRGDNIGLASFKGKYVLVDFWASWCGPCRAENPNVVKSYNKYKDKGFAILGVSLDEDSTKWKAAIIKDQLQWEQVSDLKGWKNVVAVQYGINSVPSNFLLDPNGVIIAKNLRGEALEKKLAELLDK